MHKEMIYSTTNNNCKHQHRKEFIKLIYYHVHMYDVIQYTLLYVRMCVCVCVCDMLECANSLIGHQVHLMDE
jgi:hypothetical protein